MLRVLSYNIRFGGSGRETALAAVIRAASPDIVVLQEATRPEVVERIAEAVGMPHWGAGAKRSLGYLSRVAIAHHDWHRPPPCHHAFLELAPAGLDVRIFGVHLIAVHSNWTERRRTRELEATLSSISHHASRLHTVVGDFNTLAPDEAFDVNKLPWRLRILAMIGGKTIRWQTIHKMLAAGYRDVFRTLHHHDDHKGFTFPTWDPHVRLDYAFVPAAAFERVRRCEVLNGTEARTASDHFPLVVELDV